MFAGDGVIWSVCGTMLAMATTPARDRNVVMDFIVWSSSV